MADQDIETAQASERNLSQYLRCLRLKRGFDNIATYTSKFKLPISTTYYRDLEYGRRLPSIPSAIHICRALQADERTFFLHLLKDLLPNSAHTVLQPFQDTTSKTGLYVPSTLFYEQTQKSPSKETTILTDEMSAYFQKDIRLLCILSTIFQSFGKGIRASGLETLKIKLGIKLNLNTLLKDLEAYDLIYLARDGTIHPRSRFYAYNLGDRHHRLLARKILQYKFNRAIKLFNKNKNQANKLIYLNYKVGYMKEEDFWHFSSKLSEAIQISQFHRAEIKDNAKACTFSLVTSFAPKFQVL